MNHATALGIGVVSKNTVDAAINVASLLSEPIFLICSRRQIDHEGVGGGYVNNWSTEAFADYVIRRRSSNLLVARDHGGPYQGRVTVFSGADSAIEDASQSFRADIRSGFDFLHFDTCLEEAGFASNTVALQRYHDLLGDASAFALSLNREFGHEVGTEDQMEQIASVQDTADMLDELIAATKAAGFALPDYMVVQTGTRVVATGNVGATAQITTQLSSHGADLMALAALLGRYGIKLKCHNGDYINHQTLRMLNHCGIGGMNVAPEFGTTETKTLLTLLGRYEMRDEMQEFVRLAVESGTWRKWVDNDAAYSDVHLATICGHYCFSHPEVLRIKRELDRFLTRKGGVSLDSLLKVEIERKILFYVDSLGYAQPVTAKFVT
ncbi:fructose/tagatose bisphosphate aldolase [Azospirillum agricola]|uniref:hypothetical protein n=1 Tax=Azospirillum agricola TaxID=1720247 RepID=UPI001AE4AB27|nr:hypothetical protein [Azospirillum agricola]MBP2233427.1 fructose/tagatose bisphosphate aldolase [Azospirillum agricola]